MTRNEIAKNIALKFGLEETAVSNFIEAVTGKMLDAFRKGKGVNIPEFGKFFVTPKTVNGIKINTVSFSPAKKFADSVNENFSDLEPEVISPGSLKIKNEIKIVEVPYEIVGTDFTYFVFDEEEIVDADDSAAELVKEPESVPATETAAIQDEKPAAPVSDVPVTGLVEKTATFVRDEPPYFPEPEYLKPESTPEYDMPEAFIFEEQSELAEKETQIIEEPQKPALPVEQEITELTLQEVKPGDEPKPAEEQILTESAGTILTEEDEVLIPYSTREAEIEKISGSYSALKTTDEELYGQVNKEAALDLHPEELKDNSIPVEIENEILELLKERKNLIAALHTPDVLPGREEEVLQEMSLEAEAVTDESIDTVEIIEPVLTSETGEIPEVAETEDSAGLEEFELTEETGEIAEIEEIKSTEPAEKTEEIKEIEIPEEIEIHEDTERVEAPEIAEIPSEMVKEESEKVTESEGEQTGSELTVETGTSEDVIKELISEAELEKVIEGKIDELEELAKLREQLQKEIISESSNKEMQVFEKLVESEESETSDSPAIIIQEREEFEPASLNEALQEVEIEESVPQIENHEAVNGDDVKSYDDVFIPNEKQAIPQFLTDDGGPKPPKSYLKFFLYLFFIFLLASFSFYVYKAVLIVPEKRSYIDTAGTTINDSLKTKLAADDSAGTQESEITLMDDIEVERDGDIVYRKMNDEFRIQISVFDNLADAEKYILNLKEKNFEAKIERSDMPMDKHEYRIVVGPFTSLEEAKSYYSSKSMILNFIKVITPASTGLYLM